jgi:hypothetical protein
MACISVKLQYEDRGAMRENERATRLPHMLVNCLIHCCTSYQNRAFVIFVLPGLRS